MSPRSSTESYPAFAHIGLRENPGKKPQPGYSAYATLRQDFDWRNVIFSDEVIVSNSIDSTALVYCMNGHRYDERFVRRIINKSVCVRVACWGGCQDFWNASTGGLRQKSTNTFRQM
ncbi:hypothetical protein ANN_06088 [Periplaneta americana]|uniref:Uncharacterized protein n=1 Tax=Periplaneta americana TaxID=6978 RepID=A0ABQ8TCL1_PERAM|nr:hypothetical protein ANN_06088 [Periplaneta americana]